MRDLRRYFQQPEARFDGGAFLPNGLAFVFDKKGEAVILQAWHINRRATVEEIVNKDFSICPMRPCARMGEAVDNADFVVYDLDKDLNQFIKFKSEEFKQKALKALVEADLICARRVGKR